ncbi:MAG: SemiSWEET transporter [Chloroflexi bacterium]|nr:SemiSWEET transporter [Chloroflexota bacterium]
MTTPDVLGLLAGALTTFGFVPQVVRVFRLRSAREISLPFALLSLGGIGLWLLYGIIMALPPIIYWNILTLVLLALLLYAKLRYGR